MIYKLNLLDILIKLSNYLIYTLLFLNFLIYISKTFARLIIIYFIIVITLNNKDLLK